VDIFIIVIIIIIIIVIVIVTISDNTKFLPAIHFIVGKHPRQ